MSVRRLSALGADLWRTTKPAITASNTLMAVAGLAAAWRPEAPQLGAAFAATIGTALAVAAANTFNMALEHERDALMERTRGRPVASGRLRPRAAWCFGIALTGAAMGALVFTTLAATLVGLGAIVGYAFIYTPLKAKTPHALFVGAVPGATPPLIGALALGDEGFRVGLALFILLLLWQIPHFLAIATRREADYRRAGLRPFSVTHGGPTTRALSRWTALGLVPAAVLPWAMGSLGVPAMVLLVVLGALLAASTFGPRWVSRTFVASLIYLPVMTVVVLVDRVVAHV